MQKIVGIFVGILLAAAGSAFAADRKTDQPEQILVTASLDDTGKAPQEVYIISRLGEDAEVSMPIKNELLNEDTPDVISLKFSSQLLSKHSFRFSFVATVNGDSLPQQTVKVDIEKGARINLQCGSRPLSIGVDYLTMELLRRKGKTVRGATK